MKKLVLYVLSLTLTFSFFVLDTKAISDEIKPYIIDTVITTEIIDIEDNENNTRATGLITSYGLNLTKSGSILNLTGRTFGTSEVIKSGFKDIMVQRRKTSSDPWKDYFDYGDVYADAFAANLNTKISVAANYQYRVTCKHYAKQNILMVQTISNTSNIVTTT